MLQRLALTNPKNDRMDPHGVNLTLSIFLLTKAILVTSKDKWEIKLEISAPRYLIIEWFKAKILARNKVLCKSLALQ